MYLDALSAVYFYAAVVVAAYFFIISFLNIGDMCRKAVSPSLKSGRFVSVLVPARNEEKNIEQCVHSLCNQDYEDYEILVIDDNSTDNTYAILEKLAREDARVKIYRSAPLGNDWFGKPFALQQLSAFAKGDILLFTDADTIHKQTSISWAVTNLEHTGSDFISGYTGQILKTLGERTTVPIMFFLTAFVIPMFLNKHSKASFLSAAVGQYIVVRREVFVKTGGFEELKQKTSEDIGLARHIKAQGYKTDFLDMSNQVYCRMYAGYRAAISGIGKNVADFLGKRPAVFALVILAVCLFFVLPFPLFAYIIMVMAQSPFVIHLIATNALFTLTWLLIFRMQNIGWYNALLWPLLYVNLLVIILWSCYRAFSGKGFIWKGRMVH